MDTLPANPAESAVTRPRVRDLRDYIPELGLQEYWYPALLERKVGRKKPVHLKLLSLDLAFFRNTDGSVVAVSDTCPHRGASLSRGNCHFEGTITCPYHAWTFDARGECVAVLGEGPGSVIPGRKDARVRTFPTTTHHGMVFVWIGNGQPAPIEEDIPEEFFAPDFSIQYEIVTWKANWRPAVENILDAHAFYVHRNSVEFAFMGRDAFIGISRFGPRRPRPEIVNGRALGFNMANPVAPGKRASAEERKLAYRESYPGLGGRLWPKGEKRLLWHSLVARFRGGVPPPLIASREWSCAFHLPGYTRFDFGSFVYTRASVPIDATQTRIFYFFATRSRSPIGKAYQYLRFHLWKNCTMHLNFSGQDQVVVEPQRYDQPEHLSPTDIFPIAVRRLILSHARSLATEQRSEGGAAALGAEEQLARGDALEI
jgi:phenylpropionate dioxygenase-like ring-hydroxylating dioxygenase large terminal subunit